MLEHTEEGKAPAHYKEMYVFALAPVQQLVQLAEGAGWVVSEPMRDWLYKFHSRVLGSHVREDGLRECRQVEHDNQNKKAAPRTLYGKLTSSCCLNQRHQYRSPSIAPGRTDRNVKLPEDTFKPSAKNMSTDCKSLKGTTSKTTWFSPTAQSSVSPFADLELFRTLEAGVGGDMLQSSRAWMGALVVGDNMLIRKVGANIWLMPLAHVPDSIVICIEMHAELAPCGGCIMCYIMPAAIAPVYVAVIEFSQWEAMAITWLSPLAQVRRWRASLTATKDTHYQAQRIRAVPTTDAAPASVLELAARNAFWSLPMQLLRKVTDMRKIDKVLLRGNR